MSHVEKATIMLVDDDPLVRDSASRLMEEVGFQVTSCADGNSALDRIQMESFDAVLTDIKMPRTSGIELLEKIHTITPEIPVILMTAFADFGIAVAAIQKGAFDFITKPYNPQQLIHSVAKAVDFKRLRKIEKNYQAELECRVQEVSNDLKKTHAKMLQGEKMASIGQLAAGVAHEINNPVGFINSNLKTLNKYVERLTGFIDTQAQAISSSCPPTVREEIETQYRKRKLDLITADAKDLITESLEGTDSVKNLVQNLKSFSRIDDIECKPTDINAGIESALLICGNELKYVATLNKEYGDLPLTMAYSQQLNQVFMNLLVNAAHAIQTQGEIGIRSRHEDGMIIVSISDTGCGIAKENIDKIFDPFFTTKEVGKGTGLGLSIIYDIVQKHQGDITVVSEPEKGTTFTIKLPVVPA